MVKLLNYLNSSVNFNDLLLLCFRTDVLLSTNVSSLLKETEPLDNAFSSVFSELSPCGLSYEDDLFAEIFLKKHCLVGVSSLDNSGGDNRLCTLSSVCVEMSFVVLGIIGGESDMGFLVL